jgi:hypothetical protein
MDDKPKKRRKRGAKTKAITAIDTGSIVNPGTKRSASTHERSGRAQKARKRSPSPHVDEVAEKLAHHSTGHPPVSAWPLIPA